MDEKIRIKDIAERAGVSVGTVDRVLHKRMGVNPEVAQRVRLIAESLGRDGLSAQYVCQCTGL